MEVDYHFIHERVLRQDLQVQYISTGNQLADIFTKSLSTNCFQFLCSKIMVSIDTMVLREDVEGDSESRNGKRKTGFKLSVLKKKRRTRFKYVEERGRDNCSNG